MILSFAGCRKVDVFDKGTEILVKDGEIGYVYAVDLGLPSGVKWASCNVGANSPEDYGNYYAWGETTTKDAYASDNCDTFDKSIEELQTLGYVDEIGNLTSSHDAATTNWGGDWRMPTETEMEELKNSCTWEWTTRDGVEGCKVIGPNSNSIFLPACGEFELYAISGENGWGNYWSSTCYDWSSTGSCHLSFFDSDESFITSQDRGIGACIRPVKVSGNEHPDL